MTKLTPLQVLSLAGGLAGVVIFASVIAGLVVAAAVAVQLLG